MKKPCKTIGCQREVAAHQDFCPTCLAAQFKAEFGDAPMPMSLLYPAYYKPVGDLTEIDVYAVHKLFDIQDPSGAIQHASKKLLLSGARTGGKSMRDDIREARDTLTRWLDLHEMVG